MLPIGLDEGRLPRLKAFIECRRRTANSDFEALGRFERDKVAGPKAQDLDDRVVFYRRVGMTWQLRRPAPLAPFEINRTKLLLEETQAVWKQHSGE